MDRATGVARDDDRHVAYEGSEEALRLRQLRFEAQVAPRRAAENAFLLALVDVRVLVHPVRDARQAFGRPGPLLHRLIIMRTCSCSCASSDFSCSLFRLRPRRSGP